MKFEIGKSYYATSISDHENVFIETIIARTTTTVTTEKGKTFRISLRNGIESFRPKGRYSMCPVIWADHVAV